MVLKWILKERRWEGVDWIHLTEDRSQCGGCCEYGDEPSGSIKCWEFLD
jgi:hypothetical protein